MRRFERGFTLIEMLVAMVVLLVGVTAVVELVPAAMQTNLNNRYDTASTVVVQRLRDLMLNQVLNTPTLTDPTGVFPCSATFTCSLGGGATNGDYFAGAPLLNGAIDFGKATVTGYNFTYTDPNGIPYDVRWAVETSVRSVGPISNVIVAKRYIIGARKSGSIRPAVSIFTSWVSR